MGNPPVHHPDRNAPAPAESSNGILARVRGEFIARGSKQLPPAGLELQSAPLRDVVLNDLPDLGDVKITYLLNSYRHGRSRYWHWLAVRAERIGA